MASSENITPQKGWTTDPDELDFDFYWADDKGIGSQMARERGLESPKPIMCSAPETGEGLYMFQSGSNFYIWDQMGDDVEEITRSQDLNEILEIMHKKGFKEFGLREVSGWAK
ncbi:hypothetical protein VTN96DRAFT_7701 [Rasamsonia emersonii]